LVRFLHLSDLHLGVRFPQVKVNTSILTGGSYDLMWKFNLITLRNLERAVEYAEEKGIKLLLIAGDIFDRVDNSLIFSEELSVLLERIVKNDMYAVFIAGNHDADRKGEKAASLSLFWRKVSKNIFYYNVLAEEDLLRDPITLYIKELDVSIVPLPYILPMGDWRMYLNKYLFKAASQAEGRYKLMVGHLQVIGASFSNMYKSSIPEEAVKIDGVYLSDIPYHEFDYVALGHIHLMQRVSSENVYYSGSLNRIRFDEAWDKKYFLDVEVGGRLRVTPVEVEPVKMCYVKVDVDSGTSLDEVFEAVYGECSDVRESLVGIVIRVKEEMTSDRVRYITDKLERQLFEDGVWGVKIRVDRVYQRKMDRVHPRGPETSIRELVSEYIGMRYRDLSKDERERLVQKVLEYMEVGMGEA